jgi:Spy/CpxP family protein refolding chaperone
MLRLTSVVGVAVLGLALLVGAGTSQGPKKSIGQIPSGWKKLSLTKEQEVKIRAISVEFRGKIRDLEKQIDELKAEEKRKQVQVLTEDQKDKLRKLATGESTTPRKEKDK